VPRPADPYRVTIQTADGVALAASWRPVEGNDRRRPASSSSTTSRASAASSSRSRRSWAKLGYATLAIDLRAHGESTKKNGAADPDLSAPPERPERLSAGRRGRSRIGFKRARRRRPRSGFRWAATSRSSRRARAGGRRGRHLRERAARRGPRGSRARPPAVAPPSRVRGRSRPRRLGEEARGGRASLRSACSSSRAPRTTSRSCASTPRPKGRERLALARRTRAPK
jgi:hypothetical protein